MSHDFESSGDSKLRKKDPTPAPWVRRLVAERGLVMSEKQLGWWSFHLNKFLKYCRERGDRVEVRILARAFFDSLNHPESGVPRFRVDQTKQALSAFVTGVENWHWEEEEGYGWQPRFRIKTGAVEAVEGAERDAVAGMSGVATSPELRGTGKPDLQGGSGAVEVTRQNWESRLRTALRVRHYALRTEQTYSQWTRQFLEFHAEVRLESMGAAHVQRFLEHLAVGRNVSASTQNQAFSALLFFFGKVLEREFGQLDGAIRAKRGRKLPVVMSRAEIGRFLAVTEGSVGLMLRVIYGAGLRLSECLRLRVKDVDFDRELIFVRAGKGDKDRSVPIPQVLQGPLGDHLRRIRELFAEDRERDVPGVYLPHALEAKYPNAGKEFAWQWFFPSKSLLNDPRSGLRRRHHVHKNTIMAAVKMAVKQGQIEKNASCHTLRHSYATHLVEDGVDLRSIQELLGHKSVETTMIYTHVASPASRRVHSPLDR